MAAQENKKNFFKVVIPNYNNNKYLDNCLQSILNQTFTDYSIVIVDDVSDDGSQETILKYAEKYDNIYAYLLKEKRWNGGSRNLGVQQGSESEYLLFIDSDDTFEGNDCFQTIYDLIINYNYPDCVRLSYNWCGDVKRPVILDHDTPEKLLRVCDVACWTKCIKTSLFQPFPENTLMEDVVQHISQCDVIKTVVPCFKPIVNWNRNNPTSCSTNANLQNCKWLSSMYRYCADLMDLQCKTDYCEDERRIRANRAQQDIKNNITRQ